MLPRRLVLLPEPEFVALAVGTDCEPAMPRHRLALVRPATVTMTSTTPLPVGLVALQLAVLPSASTRRPVSPSRRCETTRCRWNASTDSSRVPG